MRCWVSFRRGRCGRSARTPASIIVECKNGRSNIDMSNRSRRTPAKTVRQIQSGHRRRIQRSYNWIQSPCRDGATWVFGNNWFSMRYKMTCGFPAKKRSIIHAQIKLCLIINVLQVCPWRRPATLVSVFAVTSWRVFNGPPDWLKGPCESQIVRIPIRVLKRILDSHWEMFGF